MKAEYKSPERQKRRFMFDPFPKEGKLYIISRPWSSTNMMFEKKSAPDTEDPKFLSLTTKEFIRIHCVEVPGKAVLFLIKVDFKNYTDTKVYLEFLYGKELLKTLIDTEEWNRTFQEVETRMPIKHMEGEEQ